MKLSTSTSRIERNFGMKKAIKMLAEAGFDAIDFSTFFEEYYTEVHDKSYYLDIKKYAEDNGIYFNQAHGPDGSSFLDEEENKKRYNEVLVTMKNASYVGAETIIIHPCQHLEYHLEGNSEKLFEYNIKFYKSLIPYCEEYGIKVAVENMWQYPKMISHSTCSRPEEFIRYVDEIGSPWIVSCLDIGHCMLCREQPDEFIKKMDFRLTNLHVHDVDGIEDLHTLPFFGITDWHSVMKALKEIGYKGDLTYEANGFLVDKPLELYPQYLKLMTETGRYLISLMDKR